MGDNTIDREHIIRQFKKYTDQYDCSDVKIMLKIKHTYKVAALCEIIAQSLALSREDIDLAWMCGMLHDIGRFEQVVRYGTFIDGQSVNHAEFGADLLYKEGLYEQIVGSNFDEMFDESVGANFDKNSLYNEFRKISEIAIRSHNMFRLPDGMSEREKMYANILRDADKIDILRVNCETPREEIYNISTEELKTASVSEDVKRSFDLKSCAKRRNDNTAIDHMVSHICFAFELVYEKSRAILYEQGFIFKLLDFESDNPDTKAWFKHMREVLECEV